MKPQIEYQAVSIPIGEAFIDGDLNGPSVSRSVIVFAHGSGSSRHSPRNKYVARVLNKAGFSTLLLDLLTPDEEAIDRRTAHLRFDIELLTDRLVSATDWLSAFRHRRPAYWLFRSEHRCGCSAGCRRQPAKADRSRCFPRWSTRSGGTVIVGSTRANSANCWRIR